MKRALISVYDKTGIVELAKELIKHDFEIISTSGTAKLLDNNKIKIKKIEELTKSPEVLGGRVKTLHPKVFAGILADKLNQKHLDQVKEFGFELIDLVIVSLYPFSETIAKPDCSVTEAIEQIDIGGVSLIRAAAKNFGSVSVLVNPQQYKFYIENINKVTYDFNLKLASDAFNYIAQYDSEISNYFSKLTNKHKNDDELTIHYVLGQELRYGENPHQKAKLYQSKTRSFNDIFEKLHGKELSYINILDIDAAYNLLNEFEEPTCAILKHTNPSGAASGENILEAYKKAFACDTDSPFGGIVIVNKKLDINIAREIDKIFTEIIIAPAYEQDAYEFLVKKKNRRLIKYKFKDVSTELNIKSVSGGLLVQFNDMIIAGSEMKFVTNRKPTSKEEKDMIFAMKVAKHTKSNSVVYAKNMQTVGIGGGQPSRIDSSRIAVEKARRFGMDLEGSAVASDAYFPFADGLIEAAKAGAKCVIQPGGSVKDEEVIQAANEYGMAMIFTGIRHFRH